MEPVSSINIVKLNIHKDRTNNQEAHNQRHG